MWYNSLFDSWKKQAFVEWEDGAELRLSEMSRELMELPGFIDHMITEIHAAMPDNRNDFTQVLNKCAQWMILMMEQQGVIYNERGTYKISEQKFANLREKFHAAVREAGLSIDSANG